MKPRDAGSRDGKIPQKWCIRWVLLRSRCSSVLTVALRYPSGSLQWKAGIHERNDIDPVRVKLGKPSPSDAKISSVHLSPRLCKVQHRGRAVLLDHLVDYYTSDEVDCAFCKVLAARFRDRQLHSEKKPLRRVRPSHEWIMSSDRSYRQLESG